MQTRRRFVGGLGAAALGAFLAPLQALAQELGHARIVIGFPPGGVTDITARRIAERLPAGAYTRNSVLVENKSGAGGRIACETVKAAPPDGLTLLLTPCSCMTIFPHTYRQLGYDPFKDFAPVSIAINVTLSLAVGPLVPRGVTTLPALLQWFRENPRHASFGTPGQGGTGHFIGALIGIEAGVPLQHVGYRGSVPAISDLMGGQIAATVTPSPDALSQHRAGKLRVLATSGAERTPFTPDVPTLAEAGFEILTTDEWFGFYAPAATPAAIVAAASSGINAALKDKYVVDALAAVGVVTKASTPEQMAQSQRQEFLRWGPLVKRVGFTADS